MNQRQKLHNVTFADETALQHFIRNYGSRADLAKLLEVTKDHVDFMCRYSYCNPEMAKRVHDISGGEYAVKDMITPDLDSLPMTTLREYIKPYRDRGPAGIKELCEIFGVSKGTVNQWWLCGYVPIKRAKQLIKISKHAFTLEQLVSKRDLKIITSSTPVQDFIKTFENTHECGMAMCVGSTVVDHWLKKGFVSYKRAQDIMAHTLGKYKIEELLSSRGLRELQRGDIQGIEPHISEHIAELNGVLSSRWGSGVCYYKHPKQFFALDH